MMNWLNKLFPTPLTDPFAIELQGVLGFRPDNLKLYHQAFSHSSVENNRYGNNERLEFLGDSILDTVITEHLYNKLPNKDEGTLTDLRSKMVSRRTLNRLARAFKVQDFVQTNFKGRIPASVFGNAFEALIAAIYIDQGQAFCKNFIEEKIINIHFSLDDLEKEIVSYKKHFIQWSQKHSKSYRFELVEESGESHQKSFVIALYSEAKLLAKGAGSSKKKAEEEASKKACQDQSL